MHRRHLLAAGGGDDAGAAGTGSSPAIEAVVAEDSSPIVDLRDLACERDGDTGYGASGVARSKGDGPHYVSIAVRFVDADGVRIELLTDSITDLQPAESARWDVSSSTDAASEIARCEVTATVS